MAALARKAEAAGLTVVRSKRTNHYKIYRDGRLVTTFSGTPSDFRAVKKADSDLRRVIEGMD